MSGPLALSCPPSPREPVWKWAGDASSGPGVIGLSVVPRQHDCRVQGSPQSMAMALAVSPSLQHRLSLASVLSRWLCGARPRISYTQTSLVAMLTGRRPHTVPCTEPNACLLFRTTPSDIKHAFGIVLSQPSLRRTNQHVSSVECTL